MDHKPNHLKKPLMIVFLFATAVIGCNKEVVLKNPNDELQTASAVSSLEANGNSPAAHISASENVAIPASVSVPENLPNGNSRVATYYAVGIQKYKARIKAGSDPIVYEWVFVAPKADLYDISNTT